VIINFYSINIVFFNNIKMEDITKELCKKIDDQIIIICNNNNSYMLQKNKIKDIKLLENCIIYSKIVENEIINILIPDKYLFKPIYEFINGKNCEFNYDLFITESYLNYPKLLEYLINEMNKYFNYDKFNLLHYDIRNELYYFIPYQLIPIEKNISYKDWIDKNIKYFKYISYIFKSQGNF